MYDEALIVKAMEAARSARDDARTLRLRIGANTGEAARELAEAFEREDTANAANLRAMHDAVMQKRKEEKKDKKGAQGP